MMAFLQLYPALDCLDPTTMVYSPCSREEACSAGATYSIDWSERISLRNWMTELDLICADPSKIGIMGTITFLSIGLGSILFGGMMD